MLKRLQWLKPVQSEWYVTFFYRKHGCVCYEVPIIVPDSLAQIMLQASSRSIAWWWKSARAEPVSAFSPVIDLPETRPLTLLTPENSPDFVNDFKEMSDDGEGRYIFAFCIDKSFFRTPLTDMQLQIHLESFVSQETGSVLAVLVKLNDSSHYYVFTPHDPVENVRTFLLCLGASKERIKKSRSYQRLGTAQLESLFGLSGVNRSRPY